MIDLHHHIIWGVDDGPQTLADTLALGAAAAAAGTRTIVATPHVSWEWPANDSALIRTRVSEVNHAFAAASIDVEVLAGAEVALTRAMDLPDEELVALRLGGGPWLLVEPPFVSSSAGIEDALWTLRARGHQIVLAHPERCQALLTDRLLVERCVGAGILCSLTAGSFAGRFGRTVRRYALDLLEAGMVHDVASDAHDSVRRPPTIAPELASEGLSPELIAWLSQAMPRALLDGAPLPPAPILDVEPPSRRWGFRRSS